MTPLQIVLTVFMPTFAILVGILVNRNDVSRIDTRMNSLENRFHSDMVMVIGKLGELEARVAKLETSRQ